MTVGQEFNPYRKFTGYFVPECLLAYEDISTGAKLFLAVIYRYIGQNDLAWPSQKAMCLKMGCSLRTITSYLSELEADGFIKSTRRGMGETNVYVALWHRIFADEDGGIVAHQDTQKTAHQDTRENSNLDAQNSSIPTYSNEVSQTSRESEQKESPLTPLEDLNLEDPIEVFLVNASRRSGGPRIKLNRKADAPVVQKAQDGELIYGQYQFRCGFVEFVNQYTSDPGMRRVIQKPLAFFLANPERWIPGDLRLTPRGVPRLAHAASEAIATPEDTQPHPPPADAPQRDTELLTFPDRWDAAVPEAPSKWDWQRSDVAALTNTALDPEFRNRFDEICAIASKIRKARGETAKWVTFNWILRRKDGSMVRNWWRILTDLEYMVNPEAVREPKKTQAEKNSDLIQAVLAKRKADREKTDADI